MHNPLHRRFPRELREETGKYLAIFLLLTLTIGFVSGFLVADSSMITAYNESFEKFNIEDGNFAFREEMNRAQRKKIGNAGVQIFENYYADRKMENGSTLRLFRERSEVDLADLMEGRMPAAAGETAVDRLFARNNGIAVGDTILLADGTRLEVTGLVALSDYSTLFSDNNDSMFDSVRFGVGVMTPEGWEQAAGREIRYSYAWKYESPPADEAQERDMAEDLLKVCGAAGELEDFIPRYANQAIRFTGEDMGGDKVMIEVLLYIMIVILAFVIGVTISNTITEEASVIGTLRAMGYTRAELVRHYMAMPVLITLAGALAGNILGYTLLKDLCAWMYYNSYSLPTYVTLFNGEAFFKTTVIPVCLMAAITFLLLERRLRLTPLRFLRRDLGRKKQGGVIRLPAAIPFLSRFRTRVILQNLPNYLVLFIGILFANFLLMFGMMLPSVLQHYQETVADRLLCRYQYILKVPFDVMDDTHRLRSFLKMMEYSEAIATENETAEKFSAYTLRRPAQNGTKEEEILLYGVAQDSRYVEGVPASLEGKTLVLVSSAYADKYDTSAGDEITLEEIYEDGAYTFTVAGIYDYEVAPAVFLEQKALNRTLDLGEEYFSGYLADTPVTDIDSRYIGTVIDLESATKISRQLDVSMGKMMWMVDFFAVVVFFVLIYLLSKIIIEKNAESISMAKILGYENREISGLYIRPTTIVAVLGMIVTLPPLTAAMQRILKWMMTTEMNGWIPFYLDPKICVIIPALGIGAYAVVALLEYRKICSVPMDEALKNAE